MPPTKIVDAKHKEIIRELKEKTYKPGLTLITATGDRKICLERCKFYLDHQTHKADQWIIADDGEHGYNFHGADVYVKNKHPGDKAKSINHNFRSCLKYIQYDHVAFIEDDDCYFPNYLERLLQRLERYDLAGEGETRYYNLPHQQYRVNRNTKHASLFQTGFKTSIIEAAYVSTLKEDSAFIDSRLWDKRVNKNVFCDDVTAVGMKGLPGRPGIGMGHRPGKNSSAFKSDPNFKILKEWIPSQYVDWYINLFEEMKKQ